MYLSNTVPFGLMIKRLVGVLAVIAVLQVCALATKGSNTNKQVNVVVCIGLGIVLLRV
ncbi:hypothetical protein CRENPOLYSF2_3780010 [Crenothrix polyspora]|uniref:Uncharacterized protein n=1 Tax=Crenothrix polyspora TaxID=360316 RepID=A0A1R4HE34_9GAMM|nr:hypothetical protein CRENPOLYSF2_3780010 [Crenothrix polyspora]